MHFILCFITVYGRGYDRVGEIIPSSDMPISNSITNVGHYADYSFTFKLTNDLPSGGTISIEFPTQFKTNLGIAGNPKCSISDCTLTGYTVELTSPTQIQAGVETTVTIFAIKNPSEAGGTGNFKLITAYIGFIIDMNLVFGSVGLSFEASTLALVTVQVLPGSSNIAGDISKYLFTFQSSINIPAGSWMIITFPDSGLYIPSNPSCSSYSTTGLNIKGDLQCQTKGLKVELFGISEELLAGFQYNLRMSGTNPNWSTNLGYFSVYIFKENTNTLLAYKENIKGFQIVSSNFLEISLTPYDDSVLLSQNSIMLYKLHLRVKNPIEDRGFIIVEFPSSFSMDGEYLVWVDSGLEDFSYNDTVSVQYSIPLLKLTISNFKSVSAESNIDIILQMKNPSESGNSESLNIYSLRPDSYTVIDSNSTEAYISIDEYKSPTLSVVYPTQVVAGGVNVEINIEIVPNIEVPSEGYIAFKIPSGFDTSPLICELTPYGSGTDSAKSCEVINNVIWVQLFISTLNSPSGPGDFQASQQSTVILTLNSPNLSGYYPFIVSTYDTSKELLESGSVMVNVDPATFTSINVISASTGLSSPTVIIFQLESNIEIPSGLESDNTLETRGYLELQLPTQNDNGNDLFDLDLGIGVEEGDKISCKGISTITGLDTSELTCTVTSRPIVSSIGTPIIITISDFYSIPAGVSFEFHIAGLNYFLTADTGDVIVQGYSITNRQKTILHSSSFTLTVGSASASSRDYSASSNLQFYSNEIQELNDLTLTFDIVTAISSNTFLLFQINPTHDSGYCSDLDIQCEMSSDYKCYCYPGADLILVYLPSGLGVNVYELVISSLVNPETVATTSDQLWLYVIEDFIVVDFIDLGNLPSLVEGTMIHTAFFKDQDCAGCVNVAYEFYMRIMHKIPENGSIVITLDSSMSYSLHYSSPKPYCSYFTINGIELSEYTCTPYRNILTLSGLPYIELGYLIRIVLQGVKNPSTVGSLGTIKYESKNEYGRVIESATVNAGYLDSELVVETVDTAIVQNFPTNEGVRAEYSIFFTPTSSIGPGASIEIDFPTKNFEEFINPPDCRVSIGILFIKDCLFYGKTFTTTVNSGYHNSEVTIHILGIKNFPKGTSDSFQIRVIYDGVILQKSTSSITVSTTSSANTILTSLIHFYPKNEAETSTFEFHIKPSQDFSVNSYLTIEFPEKFDKRLGDNINCWASGLAGYLKCSVVNSWTLKVIDHEAYENCESCSIILYIWGIINPNYEKTNSGQFKVGILNVDYFEQLNENSGEIGMIPAPGYLNLISTEVNNLYARTDNKFTFNVTTATSIPSSDNLGAIWIEFPIDYVLTGSDIYCTSSNAWSGGAPECLINFNAIQLLSSSSEFAGNLVVTINSLSNPLFDIRAGYINVKVFDGNNNKIVTRSYFNLAKNKFKFEYPGPLIHINNDSIFSAERGTLSDYILISFDYPCALNLTLIPYTFGFVFIPTQISITIGDTSAYFRVSVPLDIDDTQYVINWGISGEAIPPFYTPINKSLFKVVKLKSVPITLQSIPPIPRPGVSIPIAVKLKYSPYSNINLLFSISTMYSGLSVLPKKMEFRAGQTIGYYQIFVNNDTLATESFISISLSGEDSTVFGLSKDVISFEIYENDELLPDVSSIAATRIFRSKANFVISCNKVVTVYYAYALYGTIQPSFTELTQGGPPSYSTSSIQYGTIYIDSSLIANLTLKGLAAGTSYTLFAIAVDQQNKYSELATTINITTLPIYNPAIIKLWFSQTYLTSVEKSIIQSTVALVLGLKSYQVVEAQLSSGRVLASATDEVITLLQLYLIDNPYSDDYPKPKEMISIVKKYSSYLKKSLPNFNETAGITGNEIVLAECSWYTEPYLLGTSDYRSISLAGALVEAGYLFGVAIATVNDTGVPLGFQVAAGLDAANRVTKSSYTIVELKTLKNLTFADLSPDVNYNVYVTCGNLIPGFPQINPDVKFIRWKTDADPAADLLQVDFSWILGVNFILLIN